MIIKVLGLVFLFIIQIMFPKGKSLDITDIIRIRYEKAFVKKIHKFEKKNYKFWNCDMDLWVLLECKRKQSY